MQAEDILAAIKSATINAMKAKEQAKLTVIRGISAKLIAMSKQQSISEQGDLQIGDIVKALNKMVKQRRDSIGHFTKAGRQDLVEIEQSQIAIIEQFIPETLKS